MLAVSIRKSFFVTVRKFMSLIGTLACLEKVASLGKLHIRPFQWHHKNHWRFPQSLDKMIPITLEILGHLAWWEDRDSLYKGSPLHPVEHNQSLYTDASGEGWGAHWGSLRVCGQWSTEDQLLHINVLEFNAVLLALLHF